MKRLLAAILLSTLPGLAMPHPSCAPFCWLLGEWASENGFSETWKPLGPQRLQGRGEFRRTGELRFFEDLNIQKLGQHWVYIAMPNAGPPTLFTLVSAEPTRWVFENKEHDFPQQIIYALQADGSLKTTVQGLQGGQQQQQSTVLKRRDQALPD